ncbi:MAG: hypothetical protein V1906_04000 [Candidatus Woesearchaeota archaeon]
MNNLPIRDSRRVKKFCHGIFMYSQFFGSKWYIKVYNDLFNSSAYRMELLNYGRFNDEVYSAGNYAELAKNFTKLYCRLRGNGFFHRDTLFMLGNDSKGQPSMICVMPELKQGTVLSGDNPKLRGSLEDYIGAEPNADMIFDFNYGRDKKYNVYLLDLHVFSYCTHDRLRFKPQK